MKRDDNHRLCELTACALRGEKEWISLLPQSDLCSLTRFLIVNFLNISLLLLVFSIYVLPAVFILYA